MIMLKIYIVTIDENRSESKTIEEIKECIEASLYDSPVTVRELK